MPATDERQIYNFEEAIERAAQSVLAAAGYDATYIQGQRDSLPPSRIEITFATGQALNEAVHPLDPTATVYDFFDGRLVFRIVTERPEAQSSLLSGVATLHEQWAAGVRALFQERRSPFTTTNLPYLAVKTIRPIGTVRDLDPRWLEDYTRVEFLVQFGIRSDAWPSG